MQGQTDHSKWAVTIPDSSKAVSSSRKLLQQNVTAGAAEDNLSKVSTLLCFESLLLIAIPHNARWTAWMRRLHRTMQGEKMPLAR